MIHKRLYAKDVGEKFKKVLRARGHEFLEEPTADPAFILIGIFFIHEDDIRYFAGLLAEALLDPHKKYDPYDIEGQLLIDSFMKVNKDTN